MQVYNPPVAQQLTDGLHATLQLYRQQRGFNAERYIQQKSELLNNYFRQYGLQSAVIALSGGLDSAAVLALVAHASRQQDSPITQILPVSLPVFSAGATGQADAIVRAQELCQDLNLRLTVIDLTDTQQQLKQTVDSALMTDGQSWADGQLVAYTRTPALYYITSLCTQQGKPAVIVGTTNRDEGAYLGYVGKASDGMVDLQLISDLHKSEVRHVAHTLSVVPSIMNVVPSGDMYDGRPDSEVFGADYDFVELYLQWLTTSDMQQAEIAQTWDEADRQQFAQAQQNLEHLHQYNAHKYLAGSPAVHLDILPSAVPGGWQIPAYQLPKGAVS